ncbi:MAG: metallophosphoesterase [Candidatus Nanoarchaeia archaeon]|nr:metallophosphoesterase [Candidatus Nanoarchaeia archaeon]
MEIHKDIEIVGLGLKFKDNLIIGDLQIGYEESLNKQGLMIPRFQLKDIMKELEKIFSKYKFKRIILNGDIKHEFGRISDQEWKDTLKIIDYLQQHGEVILIKGNHDTILEPIAKKRNLKTIEYYKEGDVIILHGHKIIPDLSKIIIIGHEHPAVSFKERPSEKFKCFLKGKYEKSTLIVMPSLNMLTVGTDITQANFLSPFLSGNLNNFEIYVVEENKIYNFGKLKNLI